MKNKDTVITGLALFSLFFGAGNLILPPLLGLQSGSSWIIVVIGFCLSAVCIPILGILAHARLQGTIFDFGKKVSTNFALIYSFLVYAISISLPSPRTAAVTHEMAIMPFASISPWITSTVYFALVFVFVMNRSKILDFIGKWLTPAIVLIILAIIVIASIYFGPITAAATQNTPFLSAVLEGYHTFDAIGSVVVGGVIIVSLKLKGKTNYEQNKKIISKAGFLAGFGLLIIYAGLIFTGALMEGHFSMSISRANLLNGISLKTLGNSARIALSLLVSLACFTTAVGIITGTADFCKWYFKKYKNAYLITAIIGCLLGVIMGQFNVSYIIAIALPALLFIYPITIVLIILNLLPSKLATQTVFRVVVLVCVLFSIPDFLGSIGYKESHLLSVLPLAEAGMGWVLPTVIALLVSLGIQEKRHKEVK